MDSKPLITIAIPSYNAEKTIEQCLTSALSQDWENLEIIVSDDASCDLTPSILKRFVDNRLKVICQPINLGLNENFRFCLSLARGSYITFLSSDDYLSKNSISERYRLFRKYPEASIACSDAKWEGDRSGLFEFPFGEYTPGKIVAEWSLSNAQNRQHLSSVLVPTDVVRELGLSDNLFFDWLLWLRLMLRGGVAHVALPLSTLTDYSSRATRDQMKLRSTHCRELMGVINEYRILEEPPEAHIKAMAKGNERLLSRYVWHAVLDCKRNRSLKEWKIERKTFLKLACTPFERLIIALLQPSLLLGMRKFKHYFRSLLYA